MTPESIGAPPTRLVLGAHSGRHVALRLAESRLTPSPSPAINLVYDRFLRACESGKTLTDDDDLILLAQDNQPAPSPPYTRFRSYKPRPERYGPSTATVRLTREGETTSLARSATAGPRGLQRASTASRSSRAGLGYELRAISEGRDAEESLAARGHRRAPFFGARRRHRHRLKLRRARTSRR